MPDLCTVSGIIYDGTGAVKVGAVLNVTPVGISGTLLHKGMIPATSVAGGAISFTVIQGAQYNLSGVGILGMTGNGIIVTIPSTPTASLSSLVSTTLVTATFGNPMTGLGDMIYGGNSSGLATRLPAGAEGRFLSIVSGIPAWVEGGSGGGASTLDGLTDVTITTPANDDILQRKAGVFVNRSIAQLKTDLSLSGTNTGDQNLSGYSLTTHNHDGIYEPVLGFTAVPTTRTVNGHALSANVTVSKGDVGLGSVDNLQQLPLSYLDTDVLLTANSDVKVPSQKAAKTYIDAGLAALVASSPAALDTLNELAAALGNDANFATTVSTSIGTKLAKSSNLSDLTDASAARTNLGLAIGSNVQAFNANLSTFAGIAPSSNVQTLLGAADFATFKSSLSLGNVENTALSTWAGSANIATVGTISAGVWNGTDIALANIAAASAASKLLGRGDSGAGDFQEITIGSGLTMTGTTLSASGGSGANTTLSNLGTVSLNADLLPASTQKLGSATLPFNESYIGTTTQYEKVSQSAGLISHDALGSATNISIGLTPKGTGTVIVPAATGISFGSSIHQIYISSSTIAFKANSGDAAVLTNVGIWRLASTGLMGFASGTASATNLDIAFARNAANIFEINNGTAGQFGALKLGTRSATQNTVETGLYVCRQTSGTQTSNTAGLGTAIDFNINSTTTANKHVGRMAVVYTTATDASAASDFVLSLATGGAAPAEKFRVKADSRALLGCPNSSPTDGDISNNFFTAYLDEAGNALKFRVRQSDGSYKTGSIALI